ncbi:hypothetical protein ACF2JD_04400 [Aeromonas sp. A-5]|uniref:hypothetical protein n=1 Tax=Aeromonas ichthyocola TaxID=3367746 RepID=UPI0038DD5894
MVGQGQLAKCPVEFAASSPAAQIPTGNQLGLLGQQHDSSRVSRVAKAMTSSMPMVRVMKMLVRALS